MRLLSIHCGHTSTVALLEDNKVVAAISEERLRRIKNYSGFPYKALAWIKETYVKGAPIDLVVLPSTDPAFYFSRGSYEKNLISSPLISKITSVFGGGKSDKEKIRHSPVVSFIVRLFPFAIRWYSNFIYLYIRLNRRKYQNLITAEVSKIVGISKEAVVFEDHHEMHAAATLFNLDHKKPWLVFTCDGYGDSLCATVSKYEHGALTRLAATKQRSSLGMLYAHTTRYLGMKSNEHEFKVMGLAPYAKEKHVGIIVKKLRQLIKLDEKNPLVFRSSKNLMNAASYINELYQGHRFDSIAGAVQKRTEELLTEWVTKAVEKTGIKNVALSGGVFMNVKASMNIYKLPAVSDIFVMPSAGDESLVFGGLFTGYRRLMKSKENPKPIADLYLGNEFSDKDIQAFIKEKKLESKYKVTKMSKPHAEVAKLLAGGQVVARFNGRMEWGARALGNRSILAHPSKPDTIRIINELIKDRDFWMPFTPSILESEEGRYIKNPKRIPAPYMCLAFESTEEAQKDLPAALHPYDFTMRPQVVYKSWNPTYHALISEFKKLTGVGGILNTSFNLHGEPNVCSLEDAVRTLEESGLKYLALGSYLLAKS